MHEWRYLLDDLRQCGLPDPKSAVTIDGVAMRGAWPKEGGIGVQDIVGWESGVEHRGGVTALDGSDGGVMGRPLASPRRLRIPGVIVEHSLRRLYAAQEQVGAILTSTRRDWLVVDEPLRGLKRQVLVSRTGVTQIDLDQRRLLGIFTLELEAADWRRVSVDQHKLALKPGQSGQVMNAGNAAADMAAVITGPLADLAIIGPTGQWRYLPEVRAGQSLGVDFESRLVRDNANGLQLRPSVRGVWHEAARGRTTFSVTGTGTGTVELRWRSSWT